MSILTHLSWLFFSDIARFKSFFSRDSFTKLVVLLASLLLMLGISAAIFAASFVYFSSIQTYEPYGLLTSRYLVHAGLMITLWLVFVSAVTTTTATISRGDTDLLYLIRQPQLGTALASWLILRNALPTATLLALLWIPSITAFSLIYSTLPLGIVLGFATVLTILLALGLQVLAAVTSLLVAPLVKNKETIAAITAVSGLLTVTLLLIRSLLPTQLGALLRIDIDQWDPLESTCRHASLSIL